MSQALATLGVGMNLAPQANNLEAAGVCNQAGGPPGSQRNAQVALSSGGQATRLSFCQTCPEYGQASVPGRDLRRQGLATEDSFAIGVF